MDLLLTTRRNRRLTMTKMLNDNSIDWTPPDVATKPASWDSAEDAPPVMDKYDDEQEPDDGAIIAFFAIGALGVFLCLVGFVILKVMGVL